MDINRFWQLIHQTRGDSKGDPNTQANLLISKVSSLSIEEILEYQRIFLRLLRRAYRDDLNDIADVISGGLNENGRVNFSAWLVGQGREIYEKILVDPTSLADIVSIEERYNIEAEELLFVGQIAYRNKTGSEDFDPVVSDSEQSPHREGLRKSSASVQEFLGRFKEKYPEIWAKFGWDSSN